MQTIREVHETDYEAIAAIATAVGPEPTSAAELQEQDRRTRQDPNLAFFRLVAVDDTGRVVGYIGAAYARERGTGEWSATVKVHPQHRRRGCGTALLKAAEERIAAEGGVALRGSVRGEDEASLLWVQRRGFVVERERTESVLDLTTFDRSRFDGVLERVRASGIQLVTWEGVPEHLLSEIYQVDLETSRDHPEYDGRDTTYEEFLRHTTLTPNPMVWGIAMDGERICGYSVLLLPLNPGESAYTGYTCMRREYRGRGLALACKLLTIDAALQRGIARLRTNNNPENLPMLAVNEKLGYRLVPGPKLVKKRLQPA